MTRMPEPLAIARNASELAPYLAVMGLGFLVGAWGQSAKVPVAVIAGLLMILLAVGAFILDHSSGSGSGVPGIPGS
jgi:uncharacterized membrane protein